ADSAWHFAGCMEPPDGSGYGAEPAVVCVAGNPPSVAVRAGCRCGGPAAVPGYVRRRTLHLLGRVAGACRNGTDVGQLARQPQPVPRRHGAVAGGGGETVPDRHGRPYRLMARGVVYGAGSGAAGACLAASALWRAVAGGFHLTQLGGLLLVFSGLHLFAAYKSFSLTWELPNAILRWMGIQDHQDLGEREGKENIVALGMAGGRGMSPVMAGGKEKPDDPDKGKGGG